MPETESETRESEICGDNDAIRNRFGSVRVAVLVKFIAVMLTGAATKKKVPVATPRREINGGQLYTYKPVGGNLSECARQANTL